MPKSRIEPLIKGYSLLRSLHYLVQYHTLHGLSQLVPFIGAKLTKPEPDKIKLLAQSVQSLVESDTQNIVNGVYPLDVLKPESPIDHARRVPKIFIDGLKIHWRRKKKKTKDFDRDSEALLKDLPDYYTRNFHFQTDGYLSTESAELYDHQVELLFSGTAGAMRRQLIAPIKKALGPSDGRGLTFLEIGCGTGTMTRYMKLAFPEAKIIATDVSEPYLKLARKKLEKLNGVDFLQTQGESLPFQDSRFDLVYSVYLFHELPHEARKKIILESSRVLKPDGHWGYVDSLQLGDNPEFDHALEQFPKDFHEPFYPNYVKTPMTQLVEKCGLQLVEEGSGFLSKYGLFKKL